MEWKYKCPLCDDDRSCEWENHGKDMKCGACKKTRKVPEPSDQHDAHVDQHDWPNAMADEVYKTKGTTCVIKDCKDADITLDHIVAWDNGGRTSVSNLQSMCRSHNSSKGNDDFKTWLKMNQLELR